jgi:hypothetical protein
MSVSDAGGPQGTTGPVAPATGKPVDDPVILVTGDVTYERRLARKRLATGGKSLLFDPHSYARSHAEPSGAILLGKLIARAKGDEGVIAPEPQEGPGVRYPSAYTVCAQFQKTKPKDKSDRDGDRDAVWRVESKTGIEPVNTPEITKFVPAAIADDKKERAAQASLIVVDREHANGFENAVAQWPECFRNPKPHAWVVVKWSRPKFDARSKFWNTILGNFRDRCIVIATIEHLRQFGMKISRSLSWERTVEELWSEVKAVWPLSVEGCTHFVIPFLPSGAVVFSENQGNLTARLVYDPIHIGSTWTEDYEGDMSGYTLCFAAGVVLGAPNPRPGEAVDCQDASLKIARGAIAGIVSARRLLIQGFATEKNPQPKAENEDHVLEIPQLLFPADDMALVLKTAFNSAAVNLDNANDPDRRNSQRPDGKAGHGTNGAARSPDVTPQTELEKWAAKEASRFKVREIPLGKEVHEKRWRILDAVLAGKVLKAEAASIAADGCGDDRKLAFPTLRIGKLFITDRDEMESIRAARDLMTNYMQMPLLSKPLSIAVFGSPGSGKSFAIKELARQLSERRLHKIGSELEELTFNVSQFVDPEALASALQQVRDIGLAGKMPLVFWDEFDTSFNGPLGWLRYFLAPMQDGQFQDGSMMHRVGRAIFVFAGGTSTSMRVFRSRAGSVDGLAGGTGDVPATEKEKLDGTKLPDFISRLQGFIDVPTLNYEPGRSRAATMLRRADLLRSFLLESGTDLKQSVEEGGSFRQRLNIDYGVLNAFLSVKRYNYGARSIEAIVKMSALPGKSMYDRSSLPPREQLELHVEADEFLKLAGEQWSEGTSRT